MAVLTTALKAFAAPAEEQRREITIQPGEHWWAGVIAEAHRMPFTAESRFEFDFFADTAGNQGQPLLISDQGRYLWCDEPFLLGRSILVAPVLKKGATQRSVQFPPGDWKGDDGTLVHGPCVADVKAPLSRLPWFRKTTAPAL